MEIKIGKKYKANKIFIKQYSLRNEYIRLTSLANGLATIVCEGKATPVRLDFFLANITDLSKAVESIPRSVSDWKNQHIQEIKPEEIKPEEIKPEEDIPEEDIPEEDIPEEDIPEEDIPEEDIPEEIKPEENIPEEDIPEENIPEEDPWDDTYPYNDTYPY